MILIKVGFDIKISFSFQLFNQQTNIIHVNPLYIFILFFIYLKKEQKTFYFYFCFSFFFIDNFQKKSYEKSNAILYCSYSIIFSLFNQFGLIIEHDKSEVFHFLRMTKNKESSPLDFRLTDSIILKPKHYLGFFFDKKLSFEHYICYYTNKALSTIMNMKTLGNFTRELSLVYKHLLYRNCILYIILYRFLLSIRHGLHQEMKSPVLAQRCIECVNSVLSDMNLQNNLGFSLYTVLFVCLLGVVCTWR